MRYLILLILLIASTTLDAQRFLPKSLSASYFGEVITHPGLKLGVTYELKRWGKSKIKRNGIEKVIQQSFDLSPTVGFYYHKDYQTGLFAMPELSYTRKKANGNVVAYGVGAGYMRTFIPHVYDLTSTGEIKKLHEGNNYLLTNYFISFGKDLSVKHHIPITMYIKPQFMHALPNYAGGVTYFALEIGVIYRLETN